MKKLNYTGSSKLKSRIAYLLNRKAPLPLDGNGDPDWGTVGQVLTTDGSGSTSWSSGGGGGDTVSWTQDVTTGTKIASIDINGNSTDVYAPSGGSGDTVSWTQITTTGTKIAEIDINGTPTDVYAPTSGGSTYSAGSGIDITSNTISANLKQSTPSVESSVTRTAVSNREYMVELDKDGYLAVNVPWVIQQQADWNETNTSSKAYIQNKPTLGGAASQAVANNVTTTAAGSVLDARQGKTLNDARKALIIGKKVYVTASVGAGVDYPISCTIPTGYLPLSVTGSSYMNDQGILGSPYYATSGTTKCRWKNLNTVTVTLNSQMCVFYFVKNEITVS